MCYFGSILNFDYIYTNHFKKEGRKDIFLFNDAFNTFYLWLYGVRHMVKYHTYSVRKPAAATWATLSD